MKNREYKAIFIGTKNGECTARIMTIQHEGDDEFKGWLTTKTSPGFLRKTPFSIPDFGLRPRWDTALEGDFGSWIETKIFLFDPVTLEPAPFGQLRGYEELLKFKDSQLQSKQEAINAWMKMSAMMGAHEWQDKMQARFADRHQAFRKAIGQSSFSEMYGGAYR